ncbi:MAG: hypothetical protein CR967_03390 [Proteobacteria bacterium]|nr:MAG: hypothetical protein CR967_03390 [Pseudomonadota bacterium]
MKKLLLVLMALIFTLGCSVNNPSRTETIKFIGQYDKNIRVRLSSKDHFQTALMSDHLGNKYKLKNAVSGSGVRLANEDGVEIHFKRGEGILRLGKGKKDIFLRYKE